MSHEEHSLDLRKKAGEDLSSAPETRETDTTPTHDSSWISIVWETLKYAIVAAIIIIPIRTFVAQPFVISGTSMYPTFHDGEYLIVNELIKYLGEYERGDVVILRYPNDPSMYYIKRVIGLPGETVTIRGGVVSITSPTRTEALVLNEPYVKNVKTDNSSRTLDTDEYFVMGDNRAASSDSRVWGPVPRRLMNGVALIRLLPLSAMSIHPGSLEHFGVTFE